MDWLLSSVGLSAMLGRDDTYCCDLFNVLDRLDTLFGLTKRSSLSRGRVEAGTGSNGERSSRVDGRHGGTSSTRKHSHFEMKLRKVERAKKVDEEDDGDEKKRKGDVGS